MIAADWVTREPSPPCICGADPSGPLSYHSSECLEAQVRALVEDLETARRQQAEAEAYSEADARTAAEMAARALKAEGERDELRREKGEAEVWLGAYGAGATPAGLIGGIHNLAHRAEKVDATRRANAWLVTCVAEHAKQRAKAEGDTARADAALRRIETIAAEHEGISPEAYEAITDVLRAALVVVDEAPSEAGDSVPARDQHGPSGGSSNPASLGAVEAPGQVTDGGPPEIDLTESVAYVRDAIEAAYRCAGEEWLKEYPGLLAVFGQIGRAALRDGGPPQATPGEPDAVAISRAVTAEVRIRDWEDDQRYVRVSLHVHPVPRGVDEEVHSLLVKAPEPVAGVQAGRPPGTPNDEEHEMVDGPLGHPEAS